MEKRKLFRARTNKGLTHDEISVLANMDQSTYSRKEAGISKITSAEWKKLASVLDVPLKEIFEDEDNTILISNDNSPNSKVMANSSDYCNVPEYILVSLKKYIEKLENENKFKDKEISLLKKKF